MPTDPAVSSPMHRIPGAADPAATAVLARAAQARLPWWLAFNALYAVVIAAAAWWEMPGSAVIGWAAVVLALSVLAILPLLRARPADHRGRGTAVTLVLGVAWTAAPLLFGAHGMAGAPLRALIVTQMVVAALLLAPAPGVALAFILPAGAGVAAAAVIAGAPLLAGAIGAATVAAIAVLLVLATALRRRIAVEIALAEQDRTVALLLGAFGDERSDWLWQTDDARRLVDVSDDFARRIGTDAASLEGRPLVELIAGDGRERVRAAAPVRVLADRLLRGEGFRDLVVPVTVAGEMRWWSLTAMPWLDADGRAAGFRGVGADVTEQHRSAERIDRMARFDTLTGLANRAHIIDALGDALGEGHRRGVRATLMLIDLDRFKQVNDTLGHPIGDRLLVAVAGRLRGLASAADVCGRLGGDEFAVVVPDADDRDRVEALAEQIVAALSAPYEIEGHRLHIGASVGTATAPRDGRVVETLLRNADLALYRAKDDGRGLHRCYEPQFHAAAEERRRIEGALREAIERGEMRLVYQPIVDSADSRLCGFEALLRWTHPDLGVVTPDVFLPIAEEARLIGRIGDWVMHTACRAAAGWPDHVRVSVNLAAAQLRDPQLPATVITALSHSGLDPRRLEFEIAESVFTSGGDVAIRAADRLVSLGVAMSLCDYASGQRSSFLRKDRFRTVKIDRGFVRGVGSGEPESVAIVRAIVALADSLGMATVAEGAETRSDVDRMRALGCMRVQGWTIAQPLDVEAATQLAERGRTTVRDRAVA